MTNIRQSPPLLFPVDAQATLLVFAALASFALTGGLLSGKASAAVDFSLKRGGTETAAVSATELTKNGSFYTLSTPSGADKNVTLKLRGDIDSSLNLSSTDTAFDTLTIELEANVTINAAGSQFSPFKLENNIKKVIIKGNGKTLTIKGGSVPAFNNPATELTIDEGVKVKISGITTASANPSVAKLKNVTVKNGASLELLGDALGNTPILDVASNLVIENGATVRVDFGKTADFKRALTLASPSATPTDEEVKQAAFKIAGELHVSKGSKLIVAGTNPKNCVFLNENVTTKFYENDNTSEITDAGVIKRLVKSLFNVESEDDFKKASSINNTAASAEAEAGIQTGKQDGDPLADADKKDEAKDAEAKDAEAKEGESKDAEAKKNIKAPDTGFETQNGDDKAQAGLGIVSSVITAAGAVLGFKKKFIK